MALTLIIFSTLIIFDQLTKHLFTFFIDHFDSNPVIIKYLLEFRYTENTGASLGILSGESLFFLFSTAVALIILGYAFCFTNFKTKKVYSISIALLFAGALGNAIDRVFLGYVIDFIHFPFLEMILKSFGSWSCNLADIYLTFGVILLVTHILVLDRAHHKKEVK